MKNNEKAKIKVNKKNSEKCKLKYPAAPILLDVSMDEYAKKRERTNTIENKKLKSGLKFLFSIGMTFCNSQKSVSPNPSLFFIIQNNNAQANTYKRND